VLVKEEVSRARLGSMHRNYHRNLTRPFRQGESPDQRDASGGLEPDLLRWAHLTTRLRVSAPGGTAYR
jgi:hypothetical protein